ncbi:MAG: YkgJ family cysteine cluster protein [Candidatus Gastranaerophilales bacterium]|nr:YkgJ family cysteine cluster protein [Candidatus Gastranaerophilales bacterium]
MLYKSIFLKAKERIEKRLAKIQNLSQKKAYLEFELKDEILKSEKEIRNSFKKVKCIQCGACCRLAVSEFSPDELLRRASIEDKTAKSFLEVFELYEKNTVPENLLPETLKDGDKTGGSAFFYHCKRVQIKNGKYFCPIYDKRPDVCRNFPDTPLENLPKSCSYNVWKDENEIKAMFIKALNDIRKFYLNENKKG